MKTNTVKKVLIALDYNPTAQKVAEEGFAMAKAMNAEVILLHVISDPLYYFSDEYSPIMGFKGYMDFGPLQAITIEGLKTASLSFLEKTTIHLGDKTIHTMVEEGDFAETIIQTAKSTHADIIVMGSHSKKWLENIVMGSVTKKVLDHCNKPLYIIPTKKNK
jgi:nucleotide-binding universal stress UspA family protein